VGSDPTGGLNFLLSIGMVVLVMYFMILRPQSKRQKQREQMLKQVKKSDRVLTSGGLFGTVVATKGDDVLVVRIADNVKVEVARTAVQQVLGSEAGAAE
jgi:preprotein translocase subunit YajC